GGLLINFLPLRFLDGPRVKAWNRHAWAAVEGAALVLLVLVLSHPDPAKIDHALAQPHHISQAPHVAFFAFALGSFAFWGYFRIWGTTERRGALGRPADGPCVAEGGPASALLGVELTGGLVVAPVDVVGTAAW